MSEEFGTNSEDMFLDEMLDFEQNYENNGIDGAAADEAMPFGFNSLLTDPLKVTRSKLDFSNCSQTPRNSFASNNDRKRKNPRRCLSEMLDNSSHFTSPEANTTASVFGHKDMSIDEQFSSPPFTLYTRMKEQSSADNTENDSLVANTSMSSVCSPMFSTSELNPIKRPNASKIRKSNSLVSSTQKRTPLMRWHSANEAIIKRAVQISCSDPSLIGDFSKSYVLPLIHGKHQDLKSISVDVLSQVLDGFYTEVIAECTVVDCRYPYEYNGGHIRGAKNLYTQEAILSEFLLNKTLGTQPTDENEMKRNILVFHCEFSSERGPTLSRFLRNNDRSRNKDLYPRLHHPEIYLLEGGYKAFFEKHPNLCEPSDYLPMHSKDHENELRRFRAIVRSLSCDGKTSVSSVLKSSTLTRDY
ncbi:unnamed protein product [Medioppia subpectinata]|uniref:M-phase inducer phosphatase n=1 Tax=Medioppia subpectinata TaxID=1979941 RepID=A0A7R9PXL1_9ACAR|nr:unnamed protein product [Medioppia subpectinata]CAG2104494.1 unnamed protein product [Medioppia subpectinata]